MNNFKRNISMTFLVICMIFIMLPKTQVMAAGSSMSTATNISMNTTYSGTVTNSEEHWYKFTTPNEYRTYTMSYIGIAENTMDYDESIYVDIVDSMESKISEDDIGSWGERVTYTVKLSPNTTYYVKVKRILPLVQYKTAYNFKIESKLDEPDTKAEAKEINVKETYSGNICDKYDNDYFKFITGNEGLRYEFRAVGIDDYVNLSVYDESDREVVRVDSANREGATNTVDLAPNSTYYIKVYSTWTTDYTFSAITRRMSFDWASDYTSCVIRGINTDNSNDVITAICDTWLDREVNASCVSDGKKIYKAEGHFTGDLYDYEDTKEVIIPATGHTVVQDAAIAPTCITAGKTAGSHCSACNAIITAQQIVPATGHTVVPDAAVAATCKQTGKTVGSHCSTCGTIIEAQRTIAKTQHKWSKWKVTKKPTVTSAGKKRKTCSICGDVEYEQIAKVKIKDVKIKKGKAQKITFSVLDKGDAIKTVTSPKNSKIKIKKLKKNQYQFIGSKKGIYTITVMMKSKKKFSFRVIIK